MRKHLGLLCIGASLASQPLAMGGELPRVKGDRVALASTRQVVTSTLSSLALASTGPVLGKAACNDRVRLKSWKGDYLHRPDSPQGATTWGAGVGNVWTVECVEGGKIQLRSWKGDYLHRPDSPQGVTTWSTGAGNVWTVESSGGGVSLKSWKGDYLHRADGPPGVTTWNTGIGNVWTVEVLVLGRATCNEQVRLLSWKGDYLHRPDSPQGVTTWNAGIGNVWTVECVEGGKIQLRSWKGDYLHRPDSPQGVTTWNAGIGNVWTVERSGERVSLKSWKGDYLHRPDSPQGVTTWNQGPWTVQLASEPDNSALAQKFAPVLSFDRAAASFPMSAQRWFENNCHNRRWPECEGLTTKSMEALRGGNVPTYYQVTSCGDQVRITYWWFYGYQPQCDAFGSGTHPADWEHVTVTLSADGNRASAVTFYQHGGWYTRIAGRGGFSTVGTRPVIYVGKTSHGAYHRSGGSGTCLYWEDWRNPSDTSSWESWNNLVDLQEVVPVESWIVADRTATWDWGLDASGKGAVGTHPTQQAPTCDFAACKGEKDFLGTGLIGEIVDDTNAGCRESQCKTGWKDSQIGCYRCPTGYIDCGGSCAKGTEWYECVNPFNTSRKAYETEFYHFRLPTTDSGLL